MVTGLPAAGKSTLCNALAPRLQLPVIKSDTVKEALFDSIGYSTREWTEFLSTVAIDVSFRLLGEVGPCILDVFMPRAVAEARIPDAVSEVVEIHCTIGYEAAWQRFVGRARSGDRHPGHVDGDVSFEFYRESLRPQMVDKPFDLGKYTLEVDTTREIDADLIANWVANCLREIG
jgi:predicted kinase